MRRSLRNATEIPTGRQRWKQYYKLDPLDPPSVAAVAEAWSRDVQAYDKLEFHANYPLREVLASTRPGNFLRYMPGTPKFRALVASMRKRGFTNSIMLEVDHEGHVKVGEGNHRTAAWMKVHPDLDAMVPVRFAFNNYAIRVVPDLNWKTFNDPIAADAFYAREEAERKAAEAAREAARRPVRVQPERDLPPRTKADDDQVAELMELLGGRTARKNRRR